MSLRRERRSSLHRVKRIFGVVGTGRNYAPTPAYSAINRNFTKLGNVTMFTYSCSKPLQPRTMRLSVIVFLLLSTAVFGQRTTTLTSAGTGATATDKLGIAGGALGEAPTERQLVAVGQAPTSGAGVTKAERVYYARRVLSVQQSQFSLARNAASTFPVTFRLLPDGSKAGQEYGFIVDRVLNATGA